MPSKLRESYWGSLISICFNLDGKILDFKFCLMRCLRGLRKALQIEIYFQSYGSFSLVVWLEFRWLNTLLLWGPKCLLWRKGPSNIWIHFIAYKITIKITSSGFYSVLYGRNAINVLPVCKLWPIHNTAPSFFNIDPSKGEDLCPLQLNLGGFWLWQKVHCTVYFWFFWHTHMDQVPRRPGNLQSGCLWV